MEFEPGCLASRVERRKGPRMSVCGHRAILVVTRSVEGTTTSVVRRREELACGLPAGHGGPHRALPHGDEWDGKQSERPTVLRHEDDEPSSPSS